MSPFRLFVEVVETLCRKVFILCGAWVIMLRLREVSFEYVAWIVALIDRA